MGYDVYITRAESSFDKVKFPILQTEWESLVRSDPELGVSADDWYERDVGGTTERLYPTVWLNHPDRVTFWYVDGAIETKNPDARTIRKMVELAGRLGGRVIGEEDETYGPDGEIDESAG